jgi:acetyltransferase
MGLGTPPRGGDIAFATQSGAYGMGIFTFAIDRGIRFSKVIAYGNKCDVDDVDVLRYFGQDAETKIIALFLESLERGSEFFKIAKELSLRKPIIATKTGRTAAGARAASSHTGALTGGFSIFEAAFKQSGVIFAKTGLELVDIAKALDWQPLPKGNRVGIITNSGGTGVELTDLCQEQGLEVPELPAEIQAKIKPLLLPFASARNPIDLTPDWSRFVELYYKCTVELFECPTIDIIIPILLQRAAMMQDVVAAVRDAVKECQERRGIRKPAIICWVSIKDVEKNQQILESVGIPSYEWPERTARVAGAMVRYANYLKKHGVELK